jgi:hypothetical protein
MPYTDHMTHWTIVDAYPNELLAMIAKGQLEAAGIPVRATLHQRGDALLGAVGMQNGPHNLLVPEERLAEAKKVLGEV